VLDWLRILWHLARGRRTLWQYYTNVTWRTCERCLAWHGRIGASPRAFPNPNDGCERKLLAFPVWELPTYREKARLMRRRVEEELERRRLFQEAKQMLAKAPEQALELFDRAAAVDVYIPELEQLAREHGESLAEAPELSARLREIFLRRWSEKFAKARYERLPERMRLAREKWGENRIKELFP